MSGEGDAKSPEKRIKNEVIRRTTLDDGTQVEFAVDDGDLDQLPSIAQVGEEVQIDFSNFSGNFRLRRMASPSLDGKEVKRISLGEEEESKATPDVKTGTAKQATKSPATLPAIDEATSAEMSLSPSIELGVKGSEPSPRRSLGNRTSMREVAHLGSLDNTGGRTPLHHLCADPTLQLRSLQEMILNHPDMLKVKDDRGLLPLHILGSNADLIHSADSRKYATKCALLLMDAYPEAIIVPDVDGNMPFTYLILTWVEWTFEQDSANSKRSASEGVSSSIKVGRAISSLVNSARQSNEGSARSGSRRRTEGTSQSSVHSSLHESSNRFPPVMIFDEVEWCFEMLSLGMDHLGGKPLDPSKKVRPLLDYGKQRDNRQALANNLAQIPMLLKTSLLLESQQTRSLIMECSAIRRTLLCPEVINPWLTSMIRYKKGVSAEVAVEFLTTLSELSIDDYVGIYRKPLPHDERLFKAAKLQIFEAVEGLGDVIPSLLVAGEKIMDKAVATPVVWFVMNRRIATPFTVGIGITDFKLHLTAMLAFRQLVLGRGDESEFFQLFPWMNLNSVVFFVCLHHIVRRVCETVALGWISPRHALGYFVEIWSFVDLLGIILALFVGIRVSHDDVKLHFLEGLTLGLLWIRVIGFLKVVNESLATFVLALSRMVMDIRFFCIVMFVFILMFGDLFRLTVQHNDRINCEGDIDLGEPMEEFCSAGALEAYLRVYAIVVGDVELENYNNLSSITFLWFCVTFLGAVVMLNVLIAVVTLSYSNSQESSVILFRRARAQFVASHSTMERFLRPELSRWAESMPTISLVYVLLISLRWLMLISFLLTTLWSSLYLVEMFANVSRSDDFLGSIIVGVICLMMIYSLIATFMFTLAILMEQIMPNGSDRSMLNRVFTEINVKMVKKMASKVFGIDRNDTEGGKVAVGRDNDLGVRIDRLEKKLEQVLARAEKEDEEDMEASVFVQ